MVDYSVSTIIDAAACTGCGLCERVCPLGTISMQDGKAVVTGDRSLSCGHCMAVCPVNAVSVTSLDMELSSFETISSDSRWLPHGEFDTSQLVRLMASRRSCRNYKDVPVERSVLEDLVKIGITAPSATNSQAWTFTIVPTRQSVEALAQRVAQFYEFLNRLAAKAWLRKGLKLVGRRELAAYYRDYYAYVEDGLDQWKRFGRDRLFYGAHAVIVIACTRDAILPKEDAMLASQNMILAAHSMGLGTCLIGMAVEAINRKPSIKRFLSIPDRETVYSAIAVGHPDEKYRSTAGRKKPVIRYFEG